MALHSALTKVHRLENWVYANAAARLAATGLVSGDVGKVAYQTDTASYWRLTATTPTWVPISGYPPSGVIAAGTTANIDWKLECTTFDERLLSANSTFTHVDPVDGKVIIIPIRNTVGNFTVTWVGVDNWQGTGGGAPVQTVGDEVDVYTFVCIDDVVYGSVAPGE
jgi:hypothetical protein